MRLVVDVLGHWINGMRAGWEGYLQRYRFALITVGVAAFLDFLSTVQFMLADGIEYELHPGIRYASFAIGPVLGPLIGKILQLAAIVSVTLYWRKIAGYVFFAATMMYVWAAWYNTWGRDLYEPLLFSLLPL